jgi:chemotaxis family two-component system response regulator Rcp1
MTNAYSSCKWVKPKVVLLVDDNETDVELIRRFLSRGPEGPEVVVAGNGVEALQMLHHQAPYAQAPRPDLIILDLNLPWKTGKEVLADVKQDPALKNIPVVVLSTSSAELDVSRAYQLNANCYLTKPPELDDFARTIRFIESFWLSMARLPRH